jgi:hypothetical protein
MQPSYPDKPAFDSDASSYAGPGTLLLDAHPVYQARVSAPALVYYTQYDGSISHTVPVAQPGPLGTNYLSRILWGVNVVADHVGTPILLDDVVAKNGAGAPRKYYVQDGGGVSMTPISGWLDGTLRVSYPSRDSCLANVRAYNGPESITRDGSPIAHPGQSASPTFPSQYFDYRSQADGSLRKFKYITSPPWTAPA